MRITFTQAWPACAIASGLTAVPAAHAATISRELIVQRQQLPIEHPDHRHRRASQGQRFPQRIDRTGNFVICPFTVPRDTGNANAITALTVAPRVLARQRRAQRHLHGGRRDPPGSSSRSTPAKTIATLATGNRHPDADGTARTSAVRAGTAYPGSSFASVTCNLPPQVAIRFLYAEYNYEIGT